MNYTLAKELKDAGFKQRKVGTLLFAEGVSLASSQKKWDANSAYAPTLSELIEACGQSFSNLGMTIDTEYGTQWIAKSGKNKHFGSTPEEAVARLWLVLKKLP